MTCRTALEGATRYSMLAVLIPPLVRVWDGVRPAQRSWKAKYNHRILSVCIKSSMNISVKSTQINLLNLAA